MAKNLSDMAEAQVVVTCRCDIEAQASQPLLMVGCVSSCSLHQSSFESPPYVTLPQKDLGKHKIG